MVTRYALLRELSELITDELVVVTLDPTTSEWHHLRPRAANMYLTCMGYITPIGLGLARALPHRRVVVLDSDGSFLSNLGVLATLAVERPGNLTVIVFDNEAYGFVGAPPTATAHGVDLAAMAAAAGLARAQTVRDAPSFREAVARALGEQGPAFIVAKIALGDEPVPIKSSDLREDTYRFVRHIEESEKMTILAAPGWTRSPDTWD